MTVTFPITLPIFPAFVSFDMTITHQIGRSISPFTSVTNVQEFAGAFWTMQARLPRMLVADADEWFGALASLRGGFGTFLLGDPDHTSPRGTGNGTPLVDGASQTGIILNTKGWANNETVLKRGDHFQLGAGSGAFLHLVTQDAASDGSGLAVIDLVPRLRASPADNDPLTIISPQGRWRLSRNTVQRASTLALHSVPLAALDAF